MAKFRDRGKYSLYIPAQNELSGMGITNGPIL